MYKPRLCIWARMVIFRPLIPKLFPPLWVWKMSALLDPKLQPVGIASMAMQTCLCYKVGGATPKQKKLQKTGIKSAPDFY